ncbi:MAG: VOC family protein [Pseudomonadota bacterium]
MPTQTDEKPSPPRIYPSFRCRDAEAMIAFLHAAFGFRETFAHRQDGVVEHAQLAFEDGIIMLGQDRPDAFSELVGRSGPPAGQTVYIAVEDPDSLCARAAAAGAEIVAPLSDKNYASREFVARDPEGRIWCFGTYRPGV